MFIKILSLCIMGCFMFVILKKYSPELVIFFEIAVAIIILLLLISQIKESSAEFRKLFSLADESDEIFSCILKGAIITVLTKLGTEICSDSGNKLIGSIVELSGRTMLIVLCLPFVLDTVKIAFSFLK
ncbi:MAG: SpoIIIAC/SpoIIIAD family protein [Acutalibacteraceae bacterium]